MDGLMKITQARILLYKSNPFYSYISLYLKPERKDMIGTIGIDKNGNLAYNEEFLKDKTSDEMQGLVCHEIGHLIYEHTQRRGHRDKDWYNIAGDVVINNLLLKDKMVLPEGVVVGSVFDELDNKDISKLTTEQVYDKIYKKNKKSPKLFCVIVEDDGKGGAKKGLAEAIGSAKKGKNIKGGASGEEEEKEEKGKELGSGEEAPDWKQIIAEAITFAKMRGNVPAGMERQVGALLNEKMDWKALLYKYIVHEIPFDYTYARPSRRSQVVGYYIPAIKKEALEIIVAIDTSGSISGRELKEFMSEIVGIAKSFNNLRMTVIVCDCEVKDSYELSNGNLEKVNEIKLHGGGGTSHKPVYKWVAENKPNVRFIINFTDGETEFPDAETVKTLWVLTHDIDVPFGEKIILDD